MLTGAVGYREPCPLLEKARAAGHRLAWHWAKVMEMDEQNSDGQRPGIWESWTVSADQSGQPGESRLPEDTGLPGDSGLPEDTGQVGQPGDSGHTGDPRFMADPSRPADSGAPSPTGQLPALTQPIGNPEAGYPGAGYGEPGYGQG